LAVVFVNDHRAGAQQCMTVAYVEHKAPPVRMNLAALYTNR
jgi:hypothetical protein